MTTWSRQRSLAKESLGVLLELLEDDAVSDRRLVLGYLEAKRSLAKAFEAHAVEKYADSSVMEAVIRSLTHVMRMSYPQVEDRYLRVVGFGRVHELLLAYMVPRAGLDIPSDELRMLTGDAIHTERRARDLRDLGFKLEAFDGTLGPTYKLNEAIPDLDVGAASLIRRNIRNDKAIDNSTKQRLLAEAGLPA
ncbi:hypothetical protein [Paenarthrobacter sp. NPDC090522]|uniref:hypothetical protein n=1 Tax=Paenarthrobacter sp. NPDC090522 TaxID=3364383 RepID=UPI00381ACBFD